ncbi:haloacid dehalogenase [Paenibacillus montaniterrae]|uniref:Haloacid dehalogenase n=1 Tax=Paenibacillus montaniterrae TaxID=429341 RepID=A0A919YMI6_9BACL|nr:Cof-type HAD-IIB family hydrolase [Paenibacillus montaniterrae]GIP17192.1 haloacid dehalogenase [Paenibacillus montaniterrae]
MAIKAIAVDLDGTLLNSSKQVSARSCNALLRAHQLGLKLIVATARPPRAVEMLLPEALKRISAYIYYNGAMINCSHSQFTYHQAIDSTLSARILSFIMQEPNADISIEVADQWFTISEFDASVVQAVGGEPILKSLEEMQTVSPSKIIAAGLNNWRGLVEQFGDEVNVLVTDQGQLVQIAHLQVSKELALQRLCDVYSIGLDEVIVFGDDTNDIGLFEACGHAVAMGNAIPELKQLADEVTASNDEDGVAIVVERLTAALAHS